MRNARFRRRSILQLRQNWMLLTIVVFVMVGCRSYPSFRDDSARRGITDESLGKKYLIQATIAETNNAVIDTFVYFGKKAELSAANADGATRGEYSIVASRNMPVFAWRYDFDLRMPMVFRAVYPVFREKKKKENPVFVYVWTSLGKTTSRSGEHNKAFARIFIDRVSEDNNADVVLPYDEIEFAAELQRHLSH